jgi:hypothetical protein
MTRSDRSSAVGFAEQSPQGDVPRPVTNSRMRRQIVAAAAATMASVIQVCQSKSLTSLLSSLLRVFSQSPSWPDCLASPTEGCRYVTLHAEGSQRQSPASEVRPVWLWHVLQIDLQRQDASGEGVMSSGYGILTAFRGCYVDFDVSRQTLSLGNRVPSPITIGRRQILLKPATVRGRSLKRPRSTLASAS